jgi:outer membrane protein assembly factor BamE
MKLLFSFFCIATLAASISGCNMMAPPPPPYAALIKGGNTESMPDGMQTTPAMTGFKRVVNVFKPFKQTIQQGNFISQEMLDTLKVGMTSEQVRFVLGTPLLTDAFHAERWDYAFRVQKNTGEITTSKVTVFFKENKLERFTGRDLPTEQDFIAQLAGAPQAATAKKTGTAAKPEAAPTTAPASTTTTTPTTTP